jgi:hypothetical protein
VRAVQPAANKTMAATVIAMSTRTANVLHHPHPRRQVISGGRGPPVVC